MRLLTTLLSGVVSMGVLAAPAAATALTPQDTTTTTDPLNIVKDLPIADCPQGFSVHLTDRGGRSITTVSDGREILRQTITGSSIVELTRVNGETLEILISERAVYEHHADGTATLTQQGQSGLAIDPGDPKSDPPRLGSIVWYTGHAETTGVLNEGAPVPMFATVSTQSVSGLQGDVCDMLLTGLKTRH